MLTSTPGSRPETPRTGVLSSSTDVFPVILFACQVVGPVSNQHRDHHVLSPLGVPTAISTFIWDSAACRAVETNPTDRLSISFSASATACALNELAPFQSLTELSPGMHPPERSSPQIHPFSLRGRRQQLAKFGFQFVLFICSTASHHLCNFDDVPRPLDVVWQLFQPPLRSRRVELLKASSKLERIRLGIARRRSLICALLFNDCGSCLQLFQLLSYFQTCGSNEIRSLLSIELRCVRLLCPCAIATALREFLFCFTCPPRTDATLPPFLLRPPVVRRLCTASIPTLLRRPLSHCKNQQRYVFVGPRTQRNTLATRHPEVTASEPKWLRTTR